jgi:transcription elongation factor GreA
MKKQFHLTADGVKELKEELAILISQRAEVADRIKTAREFGDLKENTEYQVARDDQAKQESRIAEIERILESVEIIAQPKDVNIVELGNTVKLVCNGKDKTLSIVGSVEADPMEGKISDESPIGKALLGKKLGEEVEIVTPSETTKYKIATIS